MMPETLDGATLEKLISAAVAAPSFHNSQPWRFRLEPDTATVLVRAAGERGLRETDPLGRALHLSVGAAVFNLRVAIAHFGWEPVVRLLPVPAQPDLLASVRLAGPPRSGGDHQPDLYQALWRRHSSRSPFSAHRPPGPVLAELEEAAHTEGATLCLPDTEETQRLLGLTAEAEQRGVIDPARRAESRGWIREGAPDGLAPAALGPRDASGRLPMRDFSALRPENQLPTTVFEPQPLIAVLSTAHDRRSDWLRGTGAGARAVDRHRAPGAGIVAAPGARVARPALGAAQHGQRPGIRPDAHPARVRPPGPGKSPDSCKRGPGQGVAPREGTVAIGSRERAIPGGCRRRPGPGR
ncbi:Acg family FMN-binding oxidoreductase [Streptomyces sp. NPDC058864]